MNTLTREQEESISKLQGPTRAQAEAMAKLIGHPPANAPKRRRTVRSLYSGIDIHRSAPVDWPDKMPALTETEAKAAGKRLYRAFRKRTFKGKIIIVTSGNRYNRLDSISMIVNPSNGWRRLVHEFSHDLHRVLRPRDKPHSDNHRHLEKDMVRYVIEHGWLDGKLKPKAKKPKPDPRIVEHDRALAAIKRWETKLKRATTALAKLRKEEKALARKRPLFTLT